MKARILCVEGRKAVNSSFVPGLRKKGFIVETVSTGNEAVERLFDVDPDLVVINAATLRTSGKRICRAIREKVDSLPIIIINGPDQAQVGEIYANEVLTLPFTTRKLINRMAPFIPGEGESVLHFGSIRLDLERKQVRCHGKETHLTPRLVHLLRLLIEHAGEVVERDSLFREVWKTAYTGDTRTLDVHISWLREAIEENPRKPIYVKTIRKVGYRLDA